jgi:hypothetical protein
MSLEEVEAELARLEEGRQSTEIREAYPENGE